MLIEVYSLNKNSVLTYPNNIYRLQTDRIVEELVRATPSKSFKIKGHSYTLGYTFLFLVPGHIINMCFLGVAQPSNKGEQLLSQMLNVSGKIALWGSDHLLCE